MSGPCSLFVSSILKSVRPTGLDLMSQFCKLYCSHSYPFDFFFIFGQCVCVCVYLFNMSFKSTHLYIDTCLDGGSVTFPL